MESVGELGGVRMSGRLIFRFKKNLVHSYGTRSVGGGGLEDLLDLDTVDRDKNVLISNVPLPIISG